MRILLVHNFYRMPGGEDQVFAAESQLLESQGHAVFQFTVHNEQVAGLGPVALARKTVWNRAIYRELGALSRKHRPEIVHFHNTFPLISPAGYYAARREGAAVVHTLHNYRLLCPGTTFYRDGKVCEDCLGRAIPWPGVVHGCYRGSRIASAGVAVLSATHRAARTWSRAVDLYLTPTEFARQKLVQGGIPADKILSKPNFLPVDPGIGEHEGRYALFVGRLTEEKGIRQLLKVWGEPGRHIPLKVAGDGPLASLLQGSHPNIEWLGQQTREQVLTLMKGAAFLVFPSEWYETFGLTIVEAFATGLPVIASKLGAAAELVSHGETGLHFRAGDPGDLAATADWAVNHPREMAAMGDRARVEYRERYTAKHNYLALMSAYHRATAERRIRRKSALLPDSDAAGHVTYREPLSPATPVKREGAFRTVFDHTRPETTSETR